jgi:hypothetical protein
MALLKDAYDILTKEYPGAIEAIGKALAKFFGWSTGLFRKESTLAEKKANLRELIPKVADDTFAAGHPDLHGYLAGLLALAASSAQLASRGVALEAFYLSGYRFYFPVPKNESSLNKGVGKAIKDVTYRVRYEDDSWYSFYAIKLVDGHPTIAALRAKISAIARSNPAEGETAAVIAAFKTSGNEVTEVTGIVKGTTGVMYFARKEAPKDIADLRSLTLDFTETDTRKTIARDLKEALDFKLIP